MKKMMDWLENSFSPKMMKINNNVWVTSIKDSIMQVLPFIFLGSIFCMLAILMDYIPNFPNFWVPFGWTMGMISLFVAFLIPFNLMEKKRLRKNRIIAGLSGVILFLIIISPQVILDGEPGFQHSAMGAGGMFVAMIAGAYSGFIMSLFGKFSFFKEDSAIPDFVRAWFDSMLPVAVVICTGWILVDIVGIDLYNIIIAIFKPLGQIIETLPGFIFMLLLMCFLYSIGISTWVLTPIFTPVMLDAIQANLNGASNLVTETAIYSSYLWVGGIGCTLPLVIMMVMSKSQQIKSLGKACLVPSIFNINEPVVFGIVAWNPVMMIPMWLQAIVLPTIVWVFTKIIPFAPIPKVMFQMWYCPFPISTWLTTSGSIQAMILLIVVVAAATAIWFPFFKVYEKMKVQEENEVK